MATVSEIRQALADKAANVYGLRTVAYQPDAPRPPVAFVMLDRSEYDLNANRGADTFFFVITVIVGRADDRAAQKNLDQYLVGSDSVKKAIEADRTLGGVVNTCRMTEARNYVSVNVGDTTYLQIELEVEVVA
ncbi:MAG TPA: hypothetical protein VIG24_04045 [Acidimicrobiia bacterium]